MSPKPIPLDWDALETAVERNAPDTESFLDRSNGQVITVVAGDPRRRFASARSQKTFITSCGSSLPPRASSTAGWSASSPRCPTPPCASG